MLTSEKRGTIPELAGVRTCAGEGTACVYACCVSVRGFFLFDMRTKTGAEDIYSDGCFRVLSAGLDAIVYVYALDLLVSWRLYGRDRPLMAAEECTYIQVNIHTSTCYRRAVF
jgi:hypothetical protein